MRTRIAQDADRAAGASVQTSTTESTGQSAGRAAGRARRPPGSALIGPFLAVGGAMIAAALIAAASLAATTAGADHQLRSVLHEDPARAAPTAHALAVRERVLLGMRWLTAWTAAHPAPLPAPPPPPPAPVPVLTDANSTATPDWACIRQHESGDQFNSPTAPGGAYGFLEITWLSLGYSGWPYEASPAVQSQAALFLYDELGWQPWSTRFVCGL